VRILIVDDNEMVRRGVRRLLFPQTTWEVCGEAINGTEAVQKARELLPDLILLDVSMPGISGLEAARLLRQEVPKAKILVMSQHDPAQLLPRVLEAGAHGCVDKSSLSTNLLPTIDSIKGSSDDRGIASVEQRQNKLPVSKPIGNSV
jgi:two-component system, NarL family, response regulator NreC